MNTINISSLCFRKAWTALCVLLLWLSSLTPTTASSALFSLCMPALPSEETAHFSSKIIFFTVCAHILVFLDGPQLYPLQRDQLQEAEEKNLIKDLIQNKSLWTKSGHISEHEMGQNVPLFHLIKYIFHIKFVFTL